MLKYFNQKQTLSTKYLNKGGLVTFGKAVVRKVKQAGAELGQAQYETG